MLTTNLTLEERFYWLKQNKPIGVESPFGVTWDIYFENEIKDPMYSYSFNNPIYVGISGISDDEMRHTLLDELDVPRQI